MKKATILFDFDGTIVDSFDAVVAVFKKISTTYNLHPVSTKEIQIFRNEGMKSAVKQMHIPLIMLPFILLLVKKELEKTILNCKPVTNIVSTLNRLVINYRLGIVTSNSEVNVVNFLSQQKIEKLFDFIYSGSSLFGKAKVLKKVINTHEINPKRIVYVGDEVRDIDAAHTIKIPVIAVSWGFNSKEVLSSKQPDYIIDHPSKLEPALDKIFKG